MAAHPYRTSHLNEVCFLYHNWLLQPGNFQAPDWNCPSHGTRLGLKTPSRLGHRPVSGKREFQPQLQIPRPPGLPCPVSWSRDRHGMISWFVTSGFLREGGGAYLSFFLFLFFFFQVERQISKVCCLRKFTRSDTVVGFFSLPLPGSVCVPIHLFSCDF